ncbi:MAG: hypothetical protein ABFD24_06055 [Anaerolineaceae bacterium]
MADYWVKLYIDILNDPKYHMLSENAKLGMLELMVVAKTAEVEGNHPKGYLPEIMEIAFYTRRTIDWWKPVIEELKNHHERPYLVELDGQLFIRKYQQRQAKISDAERQRRSRSKPLSQPVTKPVTIRDTEVEEDVDVERDVEKEEDVDVANNNIEIINQEFENSSGLSRSNCTSKEKTKWDDSLIRMVHSGVSPEIISKSIAALKAKGGYVIAGPWSIVKAVQIEMASARQTVPKDDARRYIEGPFSEFIQH